MLKDVEGCTRAAIEVVVLDGEVTAVVVGVTWEEGDDGTDGDGDGDTATWDDRLEEEASSLSDEEDPGEPPPPPPMLPMVPPIAVPSLKERGAAGDTMKSGESNEATLPPRRPGGAALRLLDAEDGEEAAPDPVATIVDERSWL